MAWKIEIAPRRSWPAALLAHSYDPLYGESSAGNENLKRIPSTMYFVPCGVGGKREREGHGARAKANACGKRSNNADENNRRLGMQCEGVVREWSESI